MGPTSKGRGFIGREGKAGKGRGWKKGREG